MPKKNDNTETIEIRLVVTGRPDEMKVLAAKWFRSNKFEALDFLAQGKKAEIIADGGGNQSQIHGAKIESSAFFAYLASSLNIQIAVEKGVTPEMGASPVTIPPASLSHSIPEQSPSPSTKVENPDDDDDDDDDWDDDEVIVNLAPGMR
jgi:hypothetical protein